MLTALLVILILVSLIVVHELGHFIAAKIFGIRVDEFGIGYPPRAFLFGKLGDTEYTLNWIPFGGFVRLFGEEEEHGARSFADAPRWKQAIVLVAGVTMNLIAAWLLFASAYSIGILHLADGPGVGTRLVVTDVLQGSPTDASGIKTGDYLISVRDTKGAEPSPLTPTTVSDFIQVHPGQEVTLTYLHAGATSTATLRPAHAVIAQEAGRPAIGIGLALVTTEAVPWHQAFVESYYQTKGAFREIVKGLWKIIHDSALGAPDLHDVVGPVGIVGAVGEASHNGWGYVLSLAAFISLNLTVINLIPIPALDGGRLAIVILESIMRRSAPKLAVQTLNALGIALIIMLMVVVTYHDIVRLLT